MPGIKRMRALASIAEAVAIVASLDDMQQAARRPRIGIVVDREEPAIRIEATLKRVPKTGGEPLDVAPVRLAAEHVAPFAAAGEAAAVAADQLVWEAEVFSHAKTK